MKKLLFTLALSAGLGASAVQAAGPDVASVLKHHAELVHANYTDTLAAARTMRAAIDAFLAQPSAESQQAA